MIESLLHRDRAIVISALTGMALLSWVYIFAGAGTGMPALHMSGLPTATHSGDAMLPMEPIPWTFNHALIIFVMWWLMMLATMLPSAAPDPTLRRTDAQASGARALHRYRALRRWVPGSVGRVQHYRCCLAMAARSHRNALVDDGYHQHRTRWASPHRCRIMAVHAPKVRLLATLSCSR